MPFRGWRIVKEAEERKRKSLFNSVMDGMAYSVMVGFGEALAVPFALFLGANNFEVGALATLPVLFGSFAQLAGARLLSFWKSRKAIILPFVFMQAMMWLFIALLPFVFSAGVVWILVAFYCIYVMLGQVVSPVWNSLMVDSVPVKERGLFFGKRNALTGITALSATLAAGFVLNLYPAELLALGFASMFLIALLYRVISFVFLKRMHEPEYIWAEAREPSFFEFLSKARKTNFGLFVLFVAFMNFSVFIAAPFFAPYMLGSLGFNYLTFTLVNAAATFSSILVMKRWGLNSDVFGNRRVFALTGFLISFVPVFWLFSADPIYLVLVQLFSGFAWAGFNLAVANFVYDSVEPGKIARYLAYQNILIGSMVVAGGFAGSLIIEVALPFLQGQGYFAAFFISMAARLVVASYFLPRVKEIRKVQPISGKNLFFNMVTIRPMQGIISEAIVLRKRFSKIHEGAKEKGKRLIKSTR